MALDCFWCCQRVEFCPQERWIVAFWFEWRLPYINGVVCGCCSSLSQRERRLFLGTPTARNSAQFGGGNDGGYVVIGNERHSALISAFAKADELD